LLLPLPLPPLPTLFPYTTLFRSRRRDTHRLDTRRGSRLAPLGRADQHPTALRPCARLLGPDYLAPSSRDVRAMSFGLTQKIAPKRRLPPVTASIATMLIFALASFSRIRTSAPTRSSPCTRNAVFFLPSFTPFFFAPRANSTGFAGTKSTCALPPLGNPVKASR